MPEEYPADLEKILARFAPGWPRTLDVGPGWYPLLGDLHEQLVQVAPGYLIQQVKSKFGALTFHASPSAEPYDHVDPFNELIEAAWWRSIETCEECAAPAGQYTIGLWVWTVCPRHAREKAAQ